ncbi:fimbrial assembly family protein [Anoxybacillus sp. B7M1]|uniref:PilN domain-containing protein n=1 Tax=unclassified Anoxybacillus TaxID=2639704 RepID=UPI0005CDA18E|nr:MULTISPECIES: PilN domain-containing protein [unclassified Anoxybacillus]ANB56241.1 fimbrial assembly family protein [Anoxybacillus sp. B2M1]ANB64620.1 fimbrial assembly family protein [Anoxybacillus sp. B7M1]
MLIDVNLLPKKEPKNAVFLIVAILLLAVLAAAGAFFYWSVQKAESEMNQLTQELKQTRALEAAEQQKLADAEPVQEVEELQKTVEWAKQYPLKTVLLLQNMAKLLPERGFLMNFSYAEDTTVSITVQFDTSEDAAYYLKRLSDAPFVANVQLKSVAAANQGDNGSADSSPEEAADAAEGKKIAPRYLAQYELRINKEALKDEKEKQP